MRCFSLAQEWKKQGGSVTFISSFNTNTLEKKVLNEGFDFIPIQKPYPSKSDLNSTLKEILINKKNSQNNQIIIIDSKKKIISGWMKKEKIAKIIRKQIELKLK